MNKDFIYLLAANGRNKLIAASDDLDALKEEGEKLQKEEIGWEASIVNGEALYTSKYHPYQFIEQVRWVGPTDYYLTTLYLRPKSTAPLLVGLFVNDKAAKKFLQENAELRGVPLEYLSKGVYRIRNDEFFLSSIRVQD